MSVPFGTYEGHEITEPELGKSVALASGYDDALKLLERRAVDHKYDNDLGTVIERSSVWRVLMN